MSADFSYQEPIKNAMALVMSQILGLFGACGSCSQRPKAAFCGVTAEMVAAAVGQSSAGVEGLRLHTFDHGAQRGMDSRVEKKYNRDSMRKRRSQGTGVLRRASEHSIPLKNASCDTFSKLQYDF